MFRIAIPLSGKMATRTFHTKAFVDATQASGFDPHFFISDTLLQNRSQALSTYHPFFLEKIADFGARRPLLRFLRDMRRYCLVTETTDLRFREKIETAIYEAPVLGFLAKALLMAVLREIPGTAFAAYRLENMLFCADIHRKQLEEAQIKAVLTPGMGSFSFYNEGTFSREAQALGIPVFAAVTNYDNLVNMGLRGFEPKAVAVWSELMADDAVRRHRLPASKVEITGPIQYDRYIAPPKISREDYLRSKGLDPSKKTVLYAGGVSINRYFEIVKLFREKLDSKNLNLVIRVYPHAKILDSDAWRLLGAMIEEEGGIHISNSLEESSDNLRAEDVQRGFHAQAEWDDLHCLLYYSDVMINHFSTMALEAAICDLPTLHVDYDANTYGFRYPCSSAFQRRQTHNLRKPRILASRLVKSPEELVRSVDDYLADRTRDQAQRKDYARSECGDLDGQATARLLKMLNSRT